MNLEKDVPLIKLSPKLVYSRDGSKFSEINSKYDFSFQNSLKNLGFNFFGLIVL